MTSFTFDVETNVSSDVFSPGGKVVQAHAAASETLKFSSNDGFVGALSDGAISFTPFDGADSFVGIAGSSYDFALESGNTFDLLSLDLAECEGSGDVVVRITTNRGDHSANTTLLSAADDGFGNYVVTKKSLDLSADPLFKGITSFTVEYVSGSGALTVAADDIVLNIGTAAPAPSLTSASYDASTGILTVLGANLGAGAIDVSKLSLTGQGGSTYALHSSGASVNGLSATGFAVTLSTADQLAVAGLLNKNGSTSATGGTAFNLAADASWQSGAAADATNAVAVSNVSAPTITSAAYDAATHVLTVTGTHLVGVIGTTNDIAVSQLTFTGQGGATYTLTSGDVEVSSATSFTVTLNGADQTGLAALFDQNGTASSGNTTYNLAVSDDWNSVVTGGDIADAVSAVTVSGVSPTVSSASYDAATGTLTVAGLNLTNGGAVDVSKLTIAGEGGSHVLTSTSVTASSTTAFTVTLNAADRLVVNGLLDKDGATAVGGATFNLAAAANWHGSAASDSTNALTVSNVSAPTITSASYDAGTHVLSVTGTQLVRTVGATNDITISTLTITGEGGATYTLSTSSNVEVTSATGFSVTLTGADIAGVAGIINLNGTTSSGGTAYNLAAADNWNGVVTGGDISDAASALTITNAPITANTVAYDASTGILSVTGFNLVNGGQVDVSKLTLTGDGGATYALTSANVNAGSASGFSVTLNTADQLAVNGLLNKDGASAVGGTTFNLALGASWQSGAGADATNAVTVSNVSTPTITSASYDASTHVLTVTGTHLVGTSGATNDVAVSHLTFTGEGGATYTLTSADVDVSSAISFSVTLNSTDQTGVAALFNKNGTASNGNTTYNLAATDDWNSVIGNADTSDAVSAVTVTGLPAVLSSATYDADAGTLVVTGINLANGGLVDVSKLTLTGQGGASYALTSADVNASSGSGFSITLNAADQLAVSGLLNKNGASAVGGTTFNLAADSGWQSGSPADATTAITVSNVNAPTITSASYDASTHVLTVTGTHLVGTSGATNDVAVSHLTFTGEGGATYTLTSGDAEVSNATSFSVTLNSTDQTGVAALFNKNGTASNGNTTYNLAATDDWNSVIGNADTSDAVSAVTVSGLPAVLSGATYDATTGTLVVSGVNLTNGGLVDVSKLTLTGQGGASYALTSADVNASSGAGFSIVLNAADQLGVNGLLNKNGASAVGGTTFNLAADSGWQSGSPADATNAVTVSNVSAPTITSAAYDVNTHVLNVTGAHLVGTPGATNDVAVSQLTVTGLGGVTYTLTSSDVEVTGATSFSVTLNSTDQAAVAGLFNKNGTASTGNTTYNLAADDDWNSVVTGGDTSDAVSAITVSGVASATVTSAAYDAATGALVVTGVNLISGDTVDVSKLTVTGQGGATYTLTSANVNASSTTGFTVSLNAADQLAVNGLFNKGGASAVGGTTFNLDAATNWHNGSSADAVNAVTVSNVSAPTITSAAYNAATHVLTVTGTHLVRTAGAANDIAVSHLTITGQGGATYALTSADVEVTSATSFSITLNSADQTQFAALFNKDGVTSTGGATYNLAASDDWNSVVSDSDTSDAVSAVTVSGIPVPPPDAPPPVNSTVDGVAVQTSNTVNTSTGLPQQTVSVPIITSTRSDDSSTPHSTLADIPLAATDTSGTRTDLVVSLPTGTGFQAEGSSTLLSSSQALLDLINRIESKTQAGSVVQAELTDEGTSFLTQLASSTKLMSQTITLTAAPGTAPANHILINGSSIAPTPGVSNSAIGLVIDTTGLPGGTVVELNNVDFAAVVGATHLRGGEGENYVVGDDAAQNIMLGAGDDNLFGGGGNDIIGSAGGNDNLDGGSGEDIVFGGIGNDKLAGGTGNDMLQGGRSDLGSWNFYLNAQGQVVGLHNTLLVDAAVTETVTRAELNTTVAELGFAGASAATLQSLSLLYHAAFQRTPDLHGLSFWARDGLSGVQAAEAFLRSAEWKAGNGKLTNAQLVDQLYQNALGHAGGAAETAAAVARLDSAPGDSKVIAEVLNTIAQSSAHAAAWQDVNGISLGGDVVQQEAGRITGSGDDMLNGGAGNDSLSGGDGIDTIVYSGQRSDYKILLTAQGEVTVVDRANGDVDVIRHIEKGTFGADVIDLNFTQMSASGLGQIGQYYQALLGRAGDVDGLNFWATTKFSPLTLAAAFMETAEFKSGAGALDDRAFIQFIEENVLSHADPASIQQWSGYLANHTRAELVVALLATPEVLAAQYSGQGLWLL
jgi:uncharacterized membrane protein